MPEIHSDYYRLVQAANDYELPILEDIAIKAGLIARCHCGSVTCYDPEGHFACDTCGYIWDMAFCEECDWYPQGLNDTHSYTRNAGTCVGGEGE